MPTRRLSIAICAVNIVTCAQSTHAACNAENFGFFGITEIDGNDAEPACNEDLMLVLLVRNDASVFPETYSIRFSFHHSGIHDTCSNTVNVSVPAQSLREVRVGPGFYCDGDLYSLNWSSSVGNFKVTVQEGWNDCFIANRYETVARPDDEDFSVSATEGECDYVRITWAHNDEEPDSGSGWNRHDDVDFFKVYRDGVFIARANPSLDSFDDTEANPGVSYSYLVGACNECDCTLTDATSGYSWALPYLARSPSPASGSINLPTSTDLGWSDEATADIYDVFFGTDSSPDEGERQGSTATSSWSLPTLMPDETYYWRIDTRNSCGTTVGDRWSFTTAGCRESNCELCQKCQGGNCVPVSCPDGKRCNNNHGCEDIPGYCNSNNDCADSCEKCSNHDCVGVSCPAGQVCDGNHGCKDGGCDGDNSLCDSCEKCSNNACVPVSCPDGQTCDGNHGCEDGGCNGDNSQCNSCEKCSNNACVPVSCPDGQICDSNHGCEDDPCEGECAANETCVSGQCVLIGSFHPADAPQIWSPDCACGTCEDGRIELCEAIGFAAAWKRGDTNDLATTVRALYLWKRGEYYVWSANESNWISDGGDVPTTCGIAFASARSGDIEIYVMNADGTNLTQLTNSPGTDRAPRWSPGGSRIAFVSLRDGHDEIYVMNADGTNQTRLTSTPAASFEPQWSPDGSRIAFTSRRDGQSEIYIMEADGSGQVKLTSSLRSSSPSWSPDGSKILYTSDTEVGRAINVMQPDGREQVRLTSGIGTYYPLWSPDGGKIAFESQRDGDPGIFVMNADGNNQVNLTGLGFNYLGVWSPDGSKIAYQNCGGGACHIYVMRDNGSDKTRITQDAGGYEQPHAWSLDGKWVFYTFDDGGNQGIKKIRIDGTQEANLTNAQSGPPVLCPVSATAE